MSDWGLAGLLTFVTFLVYWPAIHGGLIMDDTQHITKVSLRSLDGLRRIWFELGATSQYYPLLHSAFWAEYQLWGNALTPYHVVNILLHTGSALMLVAILRRLQVPGAWGAGFLFALHPLCVESVAWISEQKNTLSTFFYLAAALAYMKFDQTRERRPYLAALGLFFLALLSKSVTATLPVVLLAALWWKRGRLDLDRDLKPMTPLLATGAAMGLFTAWVERTYIGATGPDFALPVVSRIMLSGRVLWFYLAKIVWPFGYLFVYPRWDMANAALWQLVFPAGVLALAAGFWLLSRRNRAPFAVLVAFVATQIPVLGFLNVYPFLYSYVWDHFLYLASIVPLAALAAGGAWLLGKLPEGLMRKIGAAVPIAALGVLSFRHAGAFGDPGALYTDTLRHNPGAWMAHNNLGAALLLQPGRLDDAVKHFEAVLKVRPQNPDAHYNLGSAYSAMPGRSADAIREYQTALSLKADLPEALDHLGRELTQAPGRLPEAIAYLQKAIDYNPAFADAHMDLGMALAKAGRTGDALDQLETALRMDPALPGAKDNLEVLMSKTPGRAQESIGYFEAQVKAHPESADAHNGLGNALRGDPARVVEAAEQFREALRIKPDLILARMNLANTLAQMPDRQAETIGQYQAVLKQDPHFPEAHNNLGNALAAAGRKDEAAKEFEAAIADDRTSAGPHVNLGAILFDRGRLADAVAQFAEAVKLDPNLAEAHSDLAYALPRLPGRTGDALAEFEAALRIKPDPEVQQRVADLRKAIAEQQAGR